MAKVLPNGAVISNDNEWVWDGAEWIALSAASVSKKPDRVQTDHAKTLAGPSAPHATAALATEVLDAITTTGSLSGARSLLSERHASDKPSVEEPIYVEVEIDPEIEVKGYKSPKEFESDSKEMIRKGWQPQNQSALAGHVNVGRTLGKVALTGGLGLMLTGASRTKDQMTVTWVRRRTERRRIESVLQSSPLPEQSVTVSTEDIPVQIGKLADLHAQGILTDEEFATKKAQLLARM